MNELEITPKSGHLRLLIVEDDPVAASIIVAILKTTPHSWEIVTCGENALKRLSTNANFDLVLLDYHLPQMNGRECCQAIRKLEVQQQTPSVWIIAHTGEQRADQIEEILKAGANDYLPKPILPHLFMLRLLTAQYNLVRTKALRSRISSLEKTIVEATN